MVLVYLLTVLIIGAMVGCLWGLIPFFVGKAQGKPNMGQWGMLWCLIGGALSGSVLAIPIMIGFVIAILTGRNDARPIRSQPQAQMSAGYYEPASVGGLNLNCLAGPLKGRSYSIGRAGLQFGRDVDCTVRFPNEVAGISRHHCALRWQQGILVLVDLGSSYGTFQGDGRQLPPNYPVTLAPGSRFYLADPANLFQITVI